MRSLILILTVFICSSSIAQEINNYSSLFDVRNSAFTRISYDNDIFRFTDRFYSQGIGIDVFSPKLAKNPLNALLLKLKNSENKGYGISFRTHGCTPTSLTADSILYGDRPYAAAFSLGIVRTSQQNERKLRLTSKFELGMIGPVALGEQIQTGIHRITGSDIPQGWKFQIRNAPIVNYTLRIEKAPGFKLPKFLNADVYSQVKLGTFQSNLSGGLEFSLGRLNTSYSTLNHRFSFYLFSQSSATLVGYDASLIGGVINREGYTLFYSEIHPAVLRQSIGFVFGMRHFSFTFHFTYITKEIKGSLPHSWGGLRLTFY